MTDDQLIQEIEAQRSLMIAVATGGPKIQVVNREHMERRGRIAEELRRRGIDDPNPFRDLWAWYGRWTAGDMPSWASRRTHLSEMYLPLVDQIKARLNATGARVFEEPTGCTVLTEVYPRRLRAARKVNETGGLISSV